MRRVSRRSFRWANPARRLRSREAVVYLAGPHTAYMTGSVLTIDGGCSLFQFDS